MATSGLLADGWHLPAAIAVGGYVANFVEHPVSPAVESQVLKDIFFNSHTVSLSPPPQPPLVGVTPPPSGPRWSDKPELFTLGIATQGYHGALAAQDAPLFSAVSHMLPIINSRHTAMPSFRHAAGAQNVGYASDGQVCNAAAEVVMGGHASFGGTHHSARQSDVHSADSADITAMPAPGDPLAQEQGSVGICVPTAHPFTFKVNGEDVEIKQEGGGVWFYC